MAVILDIPAGVTKRHVDTLLSRRHNPFHVNGNAVVVCGHGRVKRELTEITINPAVEKPHICPCCENMFARRDDTPGLPCPTCNTLGGPCG